MSTKNCYLVTFLLFHILNDKIALTVELLFSLSQLFLEFSPRFLMSPRSNVFFLHVFAACLMADNCNSPLLVSVCFSVCVDELRWTDYREICRMLYASFEHMAVWDSVCEKGTTVSSYCKIRRHAHMARHKSFKKSCKKKKETKTTFQNICDCYRNLFIEIAWRIWIWIT